MAKVKYIYNTKTCKYEPVLRSRQQVSMRLFGFMLGAALTAFGLLTYYYLNFTTFHEQNLLNQKEVYKIRYEQMERELSGIALEYEEKLKDDSTYRVILDMEPLPKEIQQAGTGGSQNFIEISGLDKEDNVLINRQYEAIEDLTKKLYFQLNSFDEIEKEEKAKEKMWAAKPAIQPINNKELKYIASKFNPRRKHPITGQVRPHKGIDFTANTGIAIYSTGDGVVKRANYSKSFGNVIYIDHGYGYVTIYAHLSKFHVKHGQKVKRGDVIGLVGNTGLSVAPHLHYEVHYKGKAIDPINFFHRDLSNEEYEKLIEHSENSTVILD